MKTKYPDFSIAEMRALIVGKGTSPIPDTDACEMDKALNNGRFVLCWDKNPIEEVPSVGALVSVTHGRCGQTSYTVRTELGYTITYKHAKLIDTEALPMVVSGGDKPGVIKMTGYYIGYFVSPDGKEVCAVTPNRFGDDGVYYFEPKDLAFLSDVKFGITEDENG